MLEKGKRPITAILITGLTIALLLVGQYAWHKTQIEKPLTLEINQITAVKNWSIQYDADQTRVKVVLNRKADLQETYLALTGVLNKTIGEGKYQLEIQNTSSKKLTDFYQNIQPVLYEGLSTGRFTWLVSEVDQQAKNEGLETKVQLDNNYLYLQVVGQGQSIYKLLPRDNGEKQIATADTAEASNAK